MIPPIKPIFLKNEKLIKGITCDPFGREIIYANQSIPFMAIMVKTKLRLALGTYLLLPIITMKIIKAPELTGKLVLAACGPFIFSLIIAFCSKIYTRLIGKILYDPKKESLITSTLSWKGDKKDREISASDIVGVETTKIRFGLIRIVFRDGSKYLVTFTPKVEVEPKRFKQVFKWTPPQ